MQGAEALFTISSARSKTDDNAFRGLACLYFQPGVAPFSGQISTLPLLSHDPFKTHLLDGFEKSFAFFDDFTDPVSGALLNCILEPFTTPHQGFINDRSSIQIQAIEEITDDRIPGLAAFNAARRGLLHPLNDPAKIRFARGKIGRASC